MSASQNQEPRLALVSSFPLPSPFLESSYDLMSRAATLAVASATGMLESHGVLDRLCFYSSPSQPAFLKAKAVVIDVVGCDLITQVNVL